MVQAARSGKQNIIEGSMASATSKETEIKLTNVARASLEELLAAGLPGGSYGRHGPQGRGLVPWGAVPGQFGSERRQRKLGKPA